jgi:polyisoprenyl-phosphate glycosyltransferase
VNRTQPSVSIAIPVYNEVEVLPELVRRVRQLLDGLPGGPHQVVFVDDGSSDGSLVLLETEAESDPRLTIVALARNFGHQTALTAALDHVSGDVVIVMDADLQDPPEVIPLLLERYREGYDVVYAQRSSRQEGWLLRLAYFLFYRLVAHVASLQLPLDAGDFGLMSRRAVEQIRRSPERHRYLRGLRAWVGFRQVGVPVERSSRFAGRSKYSLLKLFKLAADGIFAFSVAPLRAAAVVGVVAMILSTGFAAYSLYAKLILHQTPQGFTALIVAITFLSEVQLLFLGLIGEYLGRVYEEVKGRPLYVIDRIVGQRLAGEGRRAGPVR